MGETPKISIRHLRTLVKDAISQLGTLNLKYLFQNTCLFSPKGSLLHRVNGFLVGTGNMVMIRHLRHMGTVLNMVIRHLKILVHKKVLDQAAKLAILDDQQSFTMRNWHSRQRVRNASKVGT